MTFPWALLWIYLAAGGLLQAHETIRNGWRYRRPLVAIFYGPLLLAVAVWWVACGIHMRTHPT